MRGGARLIGCDRNRHRRGLEKTKARSSSSWIGRPPIFARLRTSQMSMPCLLADLMMQFWTYFWRFRQCQLNFMPFASALHAAVAFSRATLSAADIFAAAAGVGTNAMPLTSAVAIMPAIKAVAKWCMIPSFELLLFTPRPSHHIAMVSEIECHRKHAPSLAVQACSKPCCREVPNQPCLTALYLGDVVARSPEGTDARESHDANPYASP